MHELEAKAIDSAKKGASVASELFKTDLQIDTKSGKLDYVTDADVDSQSKITKSIISDYPEDVIIGEENNSKKDIPKSGNYWIIDPIDGTSNFVAGNPFWATSVAVIRNHETKAAATIAPALSEMYFIRNQCAVFNNKKASVSNLGEIDEFTVSAALRYGTELDEEFSELLKHGLLNFGDIRRLGCSQLTLGMVARGALDACLAIQPNPNSWDTVAGVEFVRKAGGEVTDVFGNPWSLDSRGLIATNGNAHEEILNKLDDCL